MKHFIKYSILFFTAVFFTACVEEDEGLVLREDSVAPPTNVSAVYRIFDDNSGTVTVTPAATSASSFEVLFGDSAEEEPTVLRAGETAVNVYEEGEYTITITAIGATGLKATVTQNVVIQFDPPTELDFTVEVNELSVVVTPTAEGAFSFDVYFGEDPEAEPVQVMPGESASYTYAEDGIYDITVEAFGAGIATTELTKTVEVARSQVPLVAAPTPTKSAQAVISLFSGAYADVSVDTWRTDWSDGGTTYEEIEVEGNAVKKYGNLGFVGIETTTTTVDASNMTHISFDVWTIDGVGINLNLVDFGADDSFDGGDDSNQELAFDIPAQGEWVTIDVPLSDFTGLASTSNLAQYIFVGNPYQNATYFIDNFYFYNENGPVGEAPAALPLEFSSNAQVFNTFNGASFALETDPFDPSNQVGNLMNSGVEWEGMTLALEQPIDLSVDKVIRMRVLTLSPNSQILLKLENGTDDPVEVIETATDFGWNDISFDFTEANYSFPNSGAVDASGSYSQITIFVDGPTTKSGSYLFDDIRQTGLGLPLDFNSARQVMGTFNGAAFEIATNPENADDPVGQITNSGAEWEGSFISFEEPVDFSANGKVIKMDFYAAAAGTSVLLKFENGSELPIEVTATATDAGWNELFFDFSSANLSFPESGTVDATGSYSTMVIFADPGAFVAGVHYVDDIKQVN